VDFILILPTGVRIIRRALCQREELSFLTEVGHLGQDVNNSSAASLRVVANIIGVCLLGSAMDHLIERGLKF